MAKTAVQQYLKPSPERREVVSLYVILALYVRRSVSEMPPFQPHPLSRVSHLNYKLLVQLDCFKSLVFFVVFFLWNRTRHTPEPGWRLLTETVVVISPSLTILKEKGEKPVDLYAGAADAIQYQVMQTVLYIQIKSFIWSQDFLQVNKHYLTQDVHGLL